MESFFLTLGFTPNESADYADAIQATQRADAVAWIRTTTDIHEPPLHAILAKMAKQGHSGGSLVSSLRIVQYVFKHGYEALAADAIHWNNLDVYQIETARYAVFELARKRETSDIPQVVIYDRCIRASLGEDWRTSTTLAELAIRNAAARALDMVRFFNTSR
uniref:Uncharacterized protein n=1 Tax=viral metagenome TaxID=1070528 RepID=A0A6C0JJH0_9ZZZZ